jgi:hypothetical protein
MEVPIDVSPPLAWSVFSALYVGGEPFAFTAHPYPGARGSECYKSVMKREAAPDSYVTLKIPRPLYERLKQVIQGSGFHSVTEFAVYVLRDLASHHRGGEAPLQKEASVDGVSQVETEPLSPDEIEAIRQRLGSLGYL